MGVLAREGGTALDELFRFLADGVTIEKAIDVWLAIELDTYPLQNASSPIHGSQVLKTAS